MDEIDLAIIEKLTNEARTSFRKIAKDLGLSPDTVINRYTALLKNGVIRGSTVVIGPDKIGYRAMVAFTIDIAPSHIFAKDTIPVDSQLILEKIIKMRNIIIATKTFGDHDLLAIGVARDFEDLINLKNEITKIPGVENLQISFWVEKMEICAKYFIV
ncbi:MAG: Lrp/AsnC family transcriptional regulator [Candidatus Hadarchaeum sp.]|uniref:Lrp/AsnC family transcriptional regulator n=1 Tax=Candidatus Hadarchaeum sp. TaxID=2883567 RepID=UPI00316C8576